MLTKARCISEKYHMYIHIGFGLIVILAYKLLGHSFTFSEQVVLICTSIIPDMEHLLYFGTYGKKTSYTQRAINVYKKDGFLAVCKFLSQNHKENTSLYLHNVLIPISFSFIGYVIYTQGLLFLSAIPYVVVSHYLYDIFEDLLMSGKLNPNWYLQFNKSSAYKKRI